MAGDRSIGRGLYEGRPHVQDEYLESVLRCDRLIANAEGDAPMQAFWRGVKCEYQADLSGQDGSAAPTLLVACQAGPDIPGVPAR